MNEWRGWLISASTNRPNGDQSVSKLYAARIADPDAAMTAVREYTGIRDERLRILVETTVSQLRSIKVPQGKVRRIKSVSEKEQSAGR